MSTAATASAVPIAVALVAALGCFAAWAGALARESWTGAAATPTQSGRPATAHEGMPAGAVRALVGPHYRVPAPDDGAVAAAMARRVPLRRPDLRLVVERTRPAPAELPRSA
jgi:hypothetical protein